jgi:hypothetical protein
MNIFEINFNSFINSFIYRISIKFLSQYFGIVNNIFSSFRWNSSFISDIIKINVNLINILSSYIFIMIIFIYYIHIMYSYNNDNNIYFINLFIPPRWIDISTGNLYLWISYFIIYYNHWNIILSYIFIIIYSHFVDILWLCIDYILYFN